MSFSVGKSRPYKPNTDPHGSNRSTHRTEFATEHLLRDIRRQKPFALEVPCTEFVEANDTVLVPIQTLELPVELGDLQGARRRGRKQGGGELGDF